MTSQITDSFLKQLRITGPLWGASTGHRWSLHKEPVMRKAILWHDAIILNTEPHHYTQPPQWNMALHNNQWHSPKYSTKFPLDQLFDHKNRSKQQVMWFYSIAHLYISQMNWSISFLQTLRSELTAINAGFTARHDAVKAAFLKLEGLLNEYRAKVKIDESFIL